MKLSFDYETFINEIKEEIDDGILTLTDKIQILRAHESVNGYRQIIDWYYIDTNEKDFDLLSDELTINEIDNIKKQYKKDKPFLEIICVEDFLKELEFVNKVV